MRGKTWPVGDTAPIDHRRVLGELVIVLVALLLAGCAGILKPAPPDAPGPTPTPTPSPDPEPVCAPPGLVGECWHKPPGQDWQFIPKPPALPPVKPKPQARVYWHGGKTSKGKKDGTCVSGGGRCVADATPAQCAPGWCEQWTTEDGKQCFVDPVKGPRLCCPPGCEGSAQRFPKEVSLMGGTSPAWTLEKDPGSRLSLVEDPWFGIVVGKGKGRLRWCFPNGATCSKWLAINR